MQVDPNSCSWAGIFPNGNKREPTRDASTQPSVWKKTAKMAIINDGSLGFPIGPASTACWRERLSHAASYLRFLPYELKQAQKVVWRGHRALPFQVLTPSGRNETLGRAAVMVILCPT